MSEGLALGPYLGARVEFKPVTFRTEGAEHHHSTTTPHELWELPNNHLAQYSKQSLQCSFIHYGDLYSAPSRLLLRSAPDPCTAKKKSFETRVECVRKNPG